MKPATHSFTSRLLVLLFVLAMAPGLAQARKKHPPQPVPRPVPTDDLGLMINGKRLSLEQFKGQPVVLTFWHHQCIPCLHELPVLDQVQKRLGTKLVRIVAIGHHQERRVAVKNIKKLRKKGFSLEFTFDPTGSVGQKYGVKGIPHLVIIGMDGNIIYEHVGWGEHSLKPILQTLKKELMKAADTEQKIPTDSSGQAAAGTS